jgi:hypothetical protein
MGTDLTLSLALPWNSGECVSDASKALKNILEKEYHSSGTHGRKVDLLFYDGDDELCIFEFKTEFASGTELKEQVGKAIRLNRAIMEYSHYSRWGVRPDILFMTFKGEYKWQTSRASVDNVCLMSLASSHA